MTTVLDGFGLLLWPGTDEQELMLDYTGGPLMFSARGAAVEYRRDWVRVHTFPVRVVKLRVTVETKP